MNKLNALKVHSTLGEEVTFRAWCRNDKRRLVVIKGRNESYPIGQKGV